MRLEKLGSCAIVITGVFFLGVLLILMASCFLPERERERGKGGRDFLIFCYDSNTRILVDLPSQYNCNAE